MTNQYLTSGYLDQLDASISRIESFIETWTKQQGLNYNTFAILYTLATKGSCTQKQIAIEWYLPKQTVFSICKTLINDGFLVIKENPDDKREKFISLTQKGKDYALPLAQKANEFSHQVFCAYGEKRMQFLLSEMNALSDVAERMFLKNTNKE